MRRQVAALALAAALPLAGGCATLLGADPLDDAAPGTTTLHTLRVGGRTRRYLLHLPPAAAARAVPLVLAFHGDGGSAAVLRAQSGLDAAADRLGVAVAYAQGSGALGWLALSWHADRDCCGWARARRVDDVGFAVALARTVGRVPGVDGTRVAVVGFSAGGTLAMRLACEHAELVYAAADVAGAMPHEPCAPSRPVSVLLVEGAADEELRGEQRVLRLLRAPRRTHSYENALRFWARHAGCSPTWVRRDSAAEMWGESAEACPAGVAVARRTVADNPHAWPGGRRPWPFAPRPAPQVDGAALVLGFLARAERARVAR